MPDEQTGVEGQGQTEPADESTNVAALEARLRKSIEDDVVRALTEEDTNSGVYKGIQRVVAKRDKDIQSLRSERSQLEQRLATLESQYRDTVDGFNQISGTLYRNLSPEEQQRVTAELAARNNQRMREEITDLRTKIANPPQPETFQPQVNDFEEQLAQARREAHDALRDTAEQFGIDPDDKALDYGDQEEAFASRLKKLNKSMIARRKELDEQDKESVKPKVPVTPTRTGSGSGAGLPDDLGRSLLQRGAQQRIAKAREAAGIR